MDTTYAEARIRGPWDWDYAAALDKALRELAESNKAYSSDHTRGERTAPRWEEAN